MKILYILWNYPQISETYVAAEIDFALKHDFHVEVWSTLVQNEGVPAQCPVHRGTLAEAISMVRPEIIHVHYLVVAERHAKDFPGPIPVTVRAHSFDWNPEACLRAAALPAVRKIYAFPHFARQVSHPKVTALPVAYSTQRFRPAPRKDRRMVLRLGAGLPTKGLSDFFEVARALPEYRFVLGVATTGGAHDYLEVLKGMNKDGHVDLRVDLSNEEAASLTSEAAIYLDTSDPGLQLFGMPISIAEALATGSLVLARHSPEAKEFVGAAGRFYTSPVEATRIICETMNWGDEEWARVSAAAVDRARAFADSAVLPMLLEDWRSLSKS